MSSDRDGVDTTTIGHPPAGRNGGLSRATRLITRAEVARLLPMRDCIEAVEAAFRAQAAGEAVPPGVLGAHVEGGGFHVKAAGLGGERPRYAVKVNGNFFANAERFGLPRIQGLVVLCDARNGFPLAVMDSSEITALRTAAATAVAARHLARADARTVTICGCGVQGRYQLAAIRLVCDVDSVFLVDRDLASADRLAAELPAELRVETVAAGELSRASLQSDVCVLSTPSQRPLLGPDDVVHGAFVAGVGADSEEKQELDPELLRSAEVVVDSLEQCAAFGDLHHAIAAGAVSRADVHAELHQVVGGAVPGRTTDSQVFVFDSTGVALEDVAAAALAFDRAEAAGVGRVVDLFA